MYEIFNVSILKINSSGIQYTYYIEWYNTDNTVGTIL